MKRIVAFVMGTDGHSQRLRSIIAGIAELGVEVIVFGERGFAAQVAAAGGSFVDLYAGRPLDAVDAVSMPKPCRWVTFAGVHAEAIIREVAALRPSAIVHDGFAVIGRVVAQALGLPRVNVCAGHAVVAERFMKILATDPRVALAPECHRAVAALRDRHGLADASPFAYLSPPSPDLNVYCEPEPWLSPEVRRAFEPVVFFGSVAPTARGSSPFGPEASRSTKVYVAFGGIAWSYYAAAGLAAYRAIADALEARPDVRAVLSLGRAPIDGALLARRNVTVASWVDQTAALAEADVFITHHGLNSTHEAVFAEVPMIGYPVFWDQPSLAERASTLGVSVPLADEPRARITPDDVLRALDAVAARSDAMRASLAAARQWELDAMAARPEAAARILACAGVRSGDGLLA